jgi:hypothetical protein
VVDELVCSVGAPSSLSVECESGGLFELHSVGMTTWIQGGERFQIHGNSSTATADARLR